LGNPEKMANHGKKKANNNFIVTTKTANYAAKSANCRIIGHPYSSFPRPFSVVSDRNSAI